MVTSIDISESKSNNHSKTSNKKAAGASQAMKGRTKHACDKCRSRKIKCQFIDERTGKLTEITDKDIKGGNVTCKYCLKLNKVCTFEKSHKTRSRGKKKLVEEQREKEKQRESGILLYDHPTSASTIRNTEPMIPMLNNVVGGGGANTGLLNSNLNNNPSGNSKQQQPIPAITPLTSATFIGQQNQPIAPAQERPIPYGEENHVSISQLQDKIKGLFEYTSTSTTNSNFDPYEPMNTDPDNMNAIWYDGTTMEPSASVSSTPRSFWAPSMPSDNKLIEPTSEEIDKFHTIFFEENTYISEIVFKTKYLNNLKLHDPYAMCLAYMIWAYASFSSEDYYHRSDGYYFEAKRRAADLLLTDSYTPHDSSNMIELVQYFLICGDHDLKHGRTASSSMSIASAIRFSQMLGYDRIDDNSSFRRDNLLLDNRQISKSASTNSDSQSPHGLGGLDGFDSYADDALTFVYNIFNTDDISTKEAEKVKDEYEDYLLLEEKRRTYWKIFCIDKYYTIGTGLPSGISNKSSIRCRLPHTASLDLFHKSPFKAPELQDQAPFLYEALERIKRGEILYHVSTSGAQSMFLYFCEDVIIWCKDIHSPLHDKAIFTMDGIRKVLEQYEKHFKDLQMLKNLFKPYTDEAYVNYTTITFKIIHLTMLHAIIAIFTKILKENNGVFPQNEMYDLHSRFRLQCCNLTSHSLIELKSKNSKKLLVSDTFFFFTTHQVIKSSIQLIVNSNDSLNKELSVVEKQSFNNLLNNLFKVIEIFESLKTRSNVMTKMVLYYTKRLEKFYNKSYDTGFFNDILGF